MIMYTYIYTYIYIQSYPQNVYPHEISLKDVPALTSHSPGVGPETSTHRTAGRDPYEGSGNFGPSLVMLEPYFPIDHLKNQDLRSMEFDQPKLKFNIASYIIIYQYLQSKKGTLT